MLFLFQSNTMSIMLFLFQSNTMSDLDTSYCSRCGIGTIQVQNKSFLFYGYEKVFTVCQILFTDLKKYFLPNFIQTSANYYK